MFCAPRIIFVGTEGVGSRFLIFRSQPHFRRYRGRRFPFSCVERQDSFSAVPRRRVLFSCFALPDSFLAVPRASGTVFIFCARTQFPRYRERRVPFSCLALPESFPAVTRVSGPVFMFSAPGVVSCGTEGVRSRFHVLRLFTLEIS
jgi:hypothetical protein